MAILLFRLRNVPEDEADEVRALLREHHIDFYETSAGNWQLSLPALWLPDDSRKAEAEALLAAYQQQRADRARAEFAQRHAESGPVTWLSMLRGDPVRFLGSWALILVVLYLSLRWFVSH